MCWQGDISGRFFLIGVRMRASCVGKVDTSLVCTPLQEIGVSDQHPWSC